jgi:MFS family permease
MIGPLNLIRTIIKKTNYLWGLFLVAISFLVWLVPSEYHSLTILAFFFSVFGTGCIIFFDGLDYKLSGSSLLINNKKLRFVKTFGVTAALAGFLLDLFVHVITKNYIYPYFTTPIYLLLFIPGFIFYFLIIGESFFACKSILDRYFKRPHVKKINPKLLNTLHISLLILGFVGISYALYHYYNIYSEIGEFRYSTNSPITIEANLFVTMLLAISLWLVIETIGYFLKRRMLITFLCRGYFRPLLAIFLACIILAIPMEVWNIPLSLWIYTNVPFDNIQIFKVPIFVFLSWPFHYLPFLSLYLLVNKRVEEAPYELDRIKTP